MMMMMVVMMIAAAGSPMMMIAAGHPPVRGLEVGRRSPPGVSMVQLPPRSCCGRSFPSLISFLLFPCSGSRRRRRPPPPSPSPPPLGELSGGG